MRKGLLAAIVLLFVLSVPWYRDTAEPVSMVLGLPDWVAVAIGCYAAAALLNAVAWWCTEVQDPPPPDEAP